MARPDEVSGTPETAEKASNSSQGTPMKQRPPKRDERKGENSENKSSSTVASPGSSDGKRGRSRTRVSGSSHNHVEAANAADRQGYHSLMSSFGKVFHVEKRWKLRREMGSGAYGYVISAVDEISGEPVAIKMITRVTQKVQLAKRALRELTLLRHFSHENITGLIDVDISPSSDEIYIFMEPMEADLHQIIKSGQKLTIEHVQYFVYQILRGMKYVHSASVVHRDLKPGNLLVNADCELKICDFGLSRGFDAAPDENPTMMTEYVATRWYRAPEIMLAYRSYGTAVDIWAIGCIVAELMLGKPLFKGKDYVDQMNKILEVLGTPDDKVMKNIGSDKAQAYIKSLPRKKLQPLHKIIPSADQQALDFLSRLIDFDPSGRPSAADALAHPWLETYHDEQDEPVCERAFDRWRTIEDLETLDDFRNALIKEVHECRDEVRNLPPPSPEFDRRRPSVVDEEEDEIDESEVCDLPVGLSRTPSIDEHRRPSASRKASIEPGTTHPSIPETGTVEFPGTNAGNDPVVAYSRRSMFGHGSRTSSMFSVHRGTTGPPTPAEPANPPEPATNSTIKFPTSEYIIPSRNRTASMYTVGNDDGLPPQGTMDMRRLLRTLSTVSVYESGEGLAGGLADIAPIGKYIVQKDRTDDAGLQSEMPRELAEGETSESPEIVVNGTPSKGQRRFRV